MGTIPNFNTNSYQQNMYVKIVRNQKTRKIKNSVPISKFTVIIHEELISKSLFWHHKCLMNGMLRVERDTQRSSKLLQSSRLKIFKKVHFWH